MRQAAAQYQRTSAASLAGRPTECAAFNMVIRDLAACSPGPTRVAALGRNHTLWSVLVKDLSVADNALPEGLKANLMRLGFWSMRYSTLAMLRDLSLQPLIDVNRDVLEGLLAQQTAPASAGAPRGTPNLPI